MNTWWRIRNGLSLVRDGSGWRIEGEGAERACVAYAQREGDGISYRIGEKRVVPGFHQLDTKGAPVVLKSGTAVPRRATRFRTGTAYPSTGSGLAPSRGSRQAGAAGATDTRPANICMVAYTHYEGDTRVMRYAESLAARGDRVDVLALRRQDDEPDVVMNGVNVTKVQTRVRDEKGKTSYLSRLLAFLSRSAWILEKRHRQLRYDLIHVHSVPDFLVFTAWLPQLAGAKVILDIHDILPEFYASKFGSGPSSLSFKAMLMLERASARMADHVIIANDLWWERLVARSVDADKCTTILNYPDRSIFRRNGNVKTREDGRFVMLYPGTLGWHQGLDIAIRAFARIQNQEPGAEFHIYGGGSEKQNLIGLAHDLRLDNRVFFHEAVNLREIAKVMENADLGIVPKRGDSFGNEAFSTKTLEFMSLGVPLIVAGTAIDRHYFNDSVVRFFRCGDEEDLAAAMLQLIRDRQLRQQLVSNGLEFARAYDWESNKYKYLDLVDSLISGKSRAKKLRVTAAASRS